MPSETRQKKIIEKLNRAQKCSILGPQALRSRGAGPLGPPGSAPVFRWNIDMCIMNYELLEHHLFNTLYTLHRPHIWKVI